MCEITHFSPRNHMHYRFSSLKTLGRKSQTRKLEITSMPLHLLPNSQPFGKGGKQRRGELFLTKNI